MLDFEYAKALAEVVLDTTCSEKEREVRLECLTQIFGRANAYLKKGFLPDVVEAFFVRKMKGLPLDVYKRQAVSGVNLYPMMLSQTSNRVINLGSPIKLSHDRGATLQDFRNNLDKIFSRYQEAVKGIVGLMDIDIQNPVNCLHLIMKELKINQKIRNEVVELFVGQYGEEPCTAHDLYFAMHEAAFFAACEGFSAPRILKLEEDIAKTLVFDWKGFDVYGTIKL